MKTRGVILALMVTLFWGSTPAVAVDHTSIPGFTELTYPGKVKLKPTGCQIITFSYLNDEALPMKNTVFLVQIVPKTRSNPKYGGIVWFSLITSRGPNAIPSLPRAGTLEAKVCRKAWIEGKGANKMSYAGIAPGTYRLYFAGVNVNPTTGKKVGRKIEVLKPIIFY